MTKEVNVPLDWRKVNLGDCFIEGKKSHIKVDDATGFGSYPFFTSGEDVLLHNEKLTEGENIYNECPHVTKLAKFKLPSCSTFMFWNTLCRI